MIFFVKDRIGAKDVLVEYLKTKTVRADILSKSVPGNLFSGMQDRLMGIIGNAEADSALV